MKIITRTIKPHIGSDAEPIPITLFRSGKYRWVIKIREFGKDNYYSHKFFEKHLDDFAKDIAAEFNINTECQTNEDFLSKYVDDLKSTWYKMKKLIITA